MISTQMQRLGIGVRNTEPAELEAIFAEAHRTTDRAILHLLRDQKTRPELRELAVGLLINFVVDASRLGVKKREMLFGINRFESANAPGHPYEGRVPETWRRFGASVFCDEHDGAVWAFLDDSPQENAFLRFQQAEPKKVAGSLESFLAACEACGDSSPEHHDYPSYE